MRFLLLNSFAEAERRSRLGWDRLFPPEGRPRLNITSMRWAVVVHPNDGRAALAIDGDEDLLDANERAALVDTLTAEWSDESR